MSKILRGQYFLQNGETLLRACMPLRESHDKFSFVFMHLCIQM